MKHTGQPIEVIGMIPFSLEREEEAVVILQNIPCISSNVDISTILILFLKPYAGSENNSPAQVLKTFTYINKEVF